MADGEDERAVFERVELSDSEDENFDYGGVEEDLSEEDDEEDEDLAAALATIQRKRDGKGGERSTNGTSKTGRGESEEGGSEGGPAPEGTVITQVRPSVVDDFIRNFLIKVGMTRTLDSFNTEWYELQAKGRLSEEYTTKVPDIYLRNQELDEQVVALRQQLSKMQEIATRAQGTWDKFRKERDFHRMHHKRVVQEKQKLILDLKRLKKSFKAYEPTLKELERKYQVAMKEKMLTKLERDRIKARMEAMDSQMKHMQEERALAGHGARGEGSTRGLLGQASTLPKSKGQQPTMGVRRRNDSRLPSEDTVENPFLDLMFEPPPVERFALKKSFKGHLNSVSAVAFHPRKAIIASVSDDESWKIWSVPNCDLVMSGEGHRDWIAGVDFHPQGTMLVTGSGDNTVKLWDFSKASCAVTFTDHTQAVWGVAFHHTGDFLASCSMDHTARLWDISSQRCRQTFRGHVDSVNSICWQPFTNSICTGSGDKTVSLWDARSGLCMQ
ncbi:unnamed protein product, partial [Choristocarpus tenellus]